MTSQAQLSAKMPLDKVELRIPAEMWHEIFFLATTDFSYTELNHFWTSTYQPFSSHSSRNHYESDNLSLVQESESLSRTKRRIVLVCKRWHALALHLVYQVVYVGKHNSGLIAGLKRSEENCKGSGYGRFVRRIFFLAWDQKAVSKYTFARLMKYCPNASALVKACNDMTPIPATVSCLPSIKRFDWWWYHGVRPSYTTVFYFIRNIVKQAPNLEYLSIGPYEGRRILSGNNLIPDYTVETSISTLRLRDASSPDILEELARWSFPNLTNLIILDSKFITGTPAPYLNRNIKIIELGEGCLKFHLLFAQCPNVQELYFYLDSQNLLAYPFRSASIRRVGIRPGRVFVQQFLSWDRITQAFDTLCGDSFPTLRTVVLYSDDWSSFVHSKFFPPIRQQVAKSGKALEFENGPIS